MVAADEDLLKEPNKDIEANEKSLLLNGSYANEDDTKKHSWIDRARSAEVWNQILGTFHQILEELKAPPVLAAWYGESENLTRALFSYASKLAPVIIFVDEVDALLGARGNRESDLFRRMKNEFMAAWDGLSSKESQRILVLGATNRPFDLNDAIIRRMPRRPTRCSKRFQDTQGNLS